MSTITASNPFASSRTARYAVVVLAVGQAVSTLVFDRFATAPLASGEEYSPLVPPAPMFAIWGIIVTASIVWSVTAARTSTLGDETRDALSAPLALAFAGFSLWLAAASTAQTSPLTLGAFALLLTGLLTALRRAASRQGAVATWPRWERRLLSFLLGVYTGWASIAAFVNVATVTQALGAPTDGVRGAVWQSLLLLAAASTAVAIARLSRGNIWYALTASYALTGAAISAATSGYPLLAALALAAVATLAITTVLVRRAEQHRPTSGT